MEEMYQINCCRGLEGNCSNGLANLEGLEEKIEEMLDQLNFTNKLAATIVGPQRHHHLLKIGIAACPNGCARPQIKDVGIIANKKIKFREGNCIDCEKCVKTCKEGAVDLANQQIISERCLQCGQCEAVCPVEALEKEKQGYQLLIGGKLGRHPRFAQKIHSDLINEQNLVLLLEDSLKWYLNQLDKHMKFGSLLSEKGMEQFKRELTRINNY
ncbi:4Fe-4S binding protein [Natroniella sulfidigena]|uniref:4Fe-4S dicluster domain-containing protein n=1 Tax=Natroniella sulfidigena TaxID=723921 RepID=UPI00200A3055|nr:4Fe-4S dicluster domain-containing protein [Natroniella sulfidigena]MCK8817243.1 4Fe-4S binding protein [Natroniella sulfidigena]